MARTDTAALLIKHGADVNSRDKEGATPLHSSIFTGNIEIVKLLLNHGAKINARDNKGLTPLTLASKRGERAKRVVEILKLRGAKY